MIAWWAGSEEYFHVAVEFDERIYHVNLWGRSQWYPKDAVNEYRCSDAYLVFPIYDSWLKDNRLQEGRRIRIWENLTFYSWSPWCRREMPIPWNCVKAALVSLWLLDPNITPETRPDTPDRLFKFLFSQRPHKVGWRCLTPSV